MNNCKAKETYGYEQGKSETNLIQLNFIKTPTE